MSSLAARLGLDGRPLRALAAAFLLQDLRSQHFGRATATKPGETLPPLFWVTGQYVIVSGLLSAALFMRVPVQGFAWAGLTTSFLLIATAVIVEFHEVVLSPFDREVIGHRPVAGRTYAAARLINLGAFVVLLSLALNLFPATLGMLLRDSGPRFVPAYLVAALCGNVSVVAVVVLLLGAGRTSQRQEEFRDLFAWTQIVLILVVFYGAQYMLRDPDHAIERFFADPPGWARLLPSAGLAAAVARVTGNGVTAPASLTAFAAGCVGTATLLSVALLLRLARAYSAIGGGRPVPPRVHAPQPFAGGFARALTRSRPRAVVLGLTLRFLRRDGDLRMRTLPALGSVLALVILGIATHQLGNPFDASPADGAVSLAVVQMLVLAVPAMLQALRSSREHEAGWLLQAAPRSGADFAQAARLAITWAVVGPVLLMLGLLFALLWGEPHAALLAVALGALELAAVSHASVRALGVNVLFSQPPARGDSLGGAAPWLALVAGCATGTAMFQYAAAGRTSWLAANALVLAIAVVILRRGAHARPAIA